MSRSPSSDKVVVLDRDGTIVVDRGYLADPQGLEFLPGAAEGLRRLHQRGYRLVVITNQSGVGRGLLTLERLQQIHQQLAQMVRAIGAEITAIYCCPHRPDENCSCRKPQTQLLQQAAVELGFDPHAAIVVGDKRSDIEFGRRAGASTVLISSDAEVGGNTGLGADHVVKDLLEAAQIIQQLESAPPAPHICI